MASDILQEGLHGGTQWQSSQVRTACPLMFLVSILLLSQRHAQIIPVDRIVALEDGCVRVTCNQLFTFDSLRPSSRYVSHGAFEFASGQADTQVSDRIKCKVTPQPMQQGGPWLGGDDGSVQIDPVPMSEYISCNEKK